MNHSNRQAWSFPVIEQLADKSVKLGIKWRSGHLGSDLHFAKSQFDEFGRKFGKKYMKIKKIKKFPIFLRFTWDSGVVLY